MENTQEEIKETAGQTVVRNQNPYLMPGAIVLAGVLIAGAVLFGRMPGSPAPAAVQGGLAAAVAAENIEDDDPALGNPEAPVTIVEFSDFQCPYCGKFFLEAERQIIEKYVKTGKARIVYRDFPLTSIHAMAQKAAEAAECADEQGKFWEYHDTIFRNQNDLGLENLKTWAGNLGLDTERFTLCLESGKYREEVEKDARDGALLGVNGTPGFFINKHPVEGALPFEDYRDRLGEMQHGFDTLIQEALKEKE